MYAIQTDAITLVVINSEALEGRSTSSFVFRGDGGTLGSGAHDNWLLQDHRWRIRPGHADITKIDGKFCLIDSSGQTFINRSTLPLGRGRKVALRDGDELLIGEYRLKVHLGDRQSWQPGAHSLATLVDEEHEDVTVHGHASPVGSHGPGREQPQREDPIEALGGVIPGRCSTTRWWHWRTTFPDRPCWNRSIPCLFPSAMNISNGLSKNAVTKR